ncbi:MAG: hypothetical protein L6R35_006260 [Caloplaca aegaea]|nr:MAG: hypothetical protein L6R35_006260 [Caloplaca aegaea]
MAILGAGGSRMVGVVGAVRSVEGVVGGSGCVVVEAGDVVGRGDTFWPGDGSGKSEDGEGKDDGEDEMHFGLEALMA